MPTRGELWDDLKYYTEFIDMEDFIYHNIDIETLQRLVNIAKESYEKE